MRAIEHMINIIEYDRKYIVNILDLAKFEKYDLYKYMENKN